MARTGRRRPYGTGDAELDSRVRELVGALDLGRRTDVIEEMMASVLRLARGDAAQADLKLVNAALKELAYAAKVFAPYRGIRKVSIFGSSRVSAARPGLRRTPRSLRPVSSSGAGW